MAPLLIRYLGRILTKLRLIPQTTLVPSSDMLRLLIINAPNLLFLMVPQNAVLLENVFWSQKNLIQTVKRAVVKRRIIQYRSENCLSSAKRVRLEVNRVTQNIVEQQRLASASMVQTMTLEIQ